MTGSEIPSRSLSALELFTGKGGVGKTTLALAAGLAFAERGRRPIVVELGHRASLEAIARRTRGLRALPIGHAPVELAAGLHASNLELEHALTEYLAAHVGWGALARRIAAHPGLRAFFDAAPAVPEVLTLHHLERLLERFDPVLVDLDATGHARMLFELPRTLGALASEGTLGAVLGRFGALLTDGARTRVHVVTRPARLPIDETLELVRDLEARPSLTRVPRGAIVLHRAPPEPRVTPSELARLEEDADARGDASARNAAAFLARELDAWRDAREAEARLATLGGVTVTLTERAHVDDVATLCALGHEVVDALDAARRSR